MKIVIIGAGSMQFSPSLFNAITRDPALADCEIGLVDVNAKGLEIAERLACRLIKERGLSIRVKASTDRRDVLANADAVTTTIAVGGMTAFRFDVDIPSRYGCIQPVAEGTGPGGMGRALRHIPVMLEIAQDMADLCPQATLYNYTNPLTVLSRVVQKYTPIECIGLCIGPELTWRHLTDYIGVNNQDTWAKIAGINHCHWILELRRGTEDLYPLVDSQLAQKRGADKNNPDAPSNDPFHGKFQSFCFGLYETLGYFPGPGDDHVCEFFPQLFHAPGQAEAFNIIDGDVVNHQEKEHPIFFEKMRQQAYGEVALDANMFGEHSYGEESQLTQILSARRSHTPVPIYANVANQGSIRNLPDEAVVEVNCTVNSAGIEPVRVGPLPNQIAVPLSHNVMNLEVLIEAALQGSRKLATQAYLNDPYCTDIEAGSKLVNELIDALLPWLPRFQATERT